MIKIVNFRDKKELEKIKRKIINLSKVEEEVKEIIENVKKKGNKALIEYTKKFDGVELKEKDLLVSKKEIKKASEKISSQELNALQKIKRNIEKFCRKQLPKEWLIEIEKGIKIGELVRAIESVGIYVPAGKYPLVSSVLMSTIPANVAKCKNIIMCTPPSKNGKINPKILAVANLCGVDKIFKVGGAQAIAALAYGTKTIPKVNKVCGPGNIYVTMAKKLVYGDIGIDLLAGPSEIMIIAERGNAGFIAADMLSQAEHDRLTKIIFVTTNKKLALEVKKEIEKQIKELKTKSTAEEAIRKYGAIILANNIGEVIEFTNEFAPEHLEIFDRNLLKKIKNAGAIFLGPYSVVAAGDYCSGPNHVLPTNGVAKFRSGLSVLDFIKMPTIQELSKEGLKSLKETITILADIEGLEAHKKSIQKRFAHD